MTKKKPTHQAEHSGPQMEKTGQPGNVKELRSEISRGALKSSSMFRDSGVTRACTAVCMSGRGPRRLCKQEAEERVRCHRRGWGLKAHPTQSLPQRLGDLLVPGIKEHFCSPHCLTPQWSHTAKNTNCLQFIQKSHQTNSNNGNCNKSWWAGKIWYWV